jgi:hypothetical protein
MIFIGCQPGMGWQMYAWKKEGSFYIPASIYPSRQLSCIQESTNNICSITTRPIQSTTVIYYDDAKYSDASMFWKSQDPTENDMGNDSDTIPLRPRSSAAMLTTSRTKMNKPRRALHMLVLLVSRTEYCTCNILARLINNFH